MFPCLLLLVRPTFGLLWNFPSYHDRPAGGNVAEAFTPKQITWSSRLKMKINQSRYFIYTTRVHYANDVQQNQLQSCSRCSGASSTLPLLSAGPFSVRATQYLVDHSTRHLDTRSTRHPLAAVSFGARVERVPIVSTGRDVSHDVATHKQLPLRPK